MRTSERGKRFFLVAFGVFLGLLLLEGALRVREAVVGPAQTVDNRVPDPRAGFRPNPAFPGHDRRGWRNASALSQADIVAFGDSQTYGLHVSREAAWPQRLGSLLGRSVYQMASPGYAPPQYVPFLDEVLTLRPKVLLAAYYFGNDLYDSYWFIYRIGERQRSAPDPLLDALATTDPRLRSAVEQAEQADPKYPRAASVDCGQPPVPVSDPVRLLYGPFPALPETKAVKASPSRPRGRQIRGLLKQSLVLRSASRGVRTLLPAADDEPSADYGPPLCVHYRDGNLRTVLNVGLRLFSLDDADPRTVEGERIVFQALRLMAERSRRDAIPFYVVLIPSKETAFRARAEPALRGEKYLVRLWNAEVRARDAALRFFAREHIAVIDTLPALEAMIASDVNPYKIDANGHPKAEGYDAIARALADRLSQDGVPRP